MADTGKDQWKVIMVAVSNSRYPEMHLRAKLGLRFLKKRKFHARLHPNYNTALEHFEERFSRTLMLDHV